jgi:hypothetical protein
VGAGLGLLAGMMIRLYASRPRLVAASAAGILLASACGPVLSAATRLFTDLVIAARLDLGHMHTAMVRGDEIGAMLGAITGAIVGAAGAWIGVRTGAAESPENASESARSFGVTENIDRSAGEASASP